ncbi:MAG: SpoIIE family protein phosphatase [Planctomycetota bacterium]
MKRDPTGISMGLGAAMHRSAVVRTWGTLGITVAGLLVAALRIVTEGFIYDGTVLILMLGTLAFEGAVLIQLRRAERMEAPSTRLVFVQTMFECSLPTTFLIVLWVYDRIVPPPLLVTPAIMSYSVMVMLTVLHLRPWLTGLAGLYCALQHGTLVAVAAWRGDLAESQLGAAVLSTYPILLAFIAAAGWFVTTWVRTDVEEAVEEAQRVAEYEGELAAAGTVQRGLLPKTPPTLAGWAVSGWSRPAEQTGGDYWDWTEVSDGKVAVSIGDVAGHGLGPALMTASCHAYARSSLHHNEGLDLALSEFAKRLARDMPDGRFVTHAAALLSPNTAEVPYLSAGQAPSLLVRAGSGEVVAIDANGPPLGFDPDVRFDRVPTLEFAPGDALMMITDGFYEWENGDGKVWGIERLTESLGAHRQLGPAEMIAAVLGDVEAFVAGASQPDDLTAVVIKRVVS